RQIDSLFVMASSGEVRYRDMVEPAIEEIAAIGAGAMPILIDKFASKSPRERHTVRKIIQKIGVPAIPDLVAALTHPDWHIVNRCCWVLADVGDSTVVKPLQKVSDHERWMVRSQAVTALGKIGVGGAEQTVRQALDDSVGLVRKSAAVAIGRLGFAEAIPELVHVLGDDFYGARMASMEALLKLDSSVVITTLADSLNSDNDFVGDLGCRVLGELASDEAMDLLLAQTESVDPDRRAHAAVALFEADPEDMCGWRDAIIEAETDRLTRLKIESVLRSTE
ncbi:MAG: HEAT repeat domain-containing protein, partial [candidate division Zixibacteria bacterium]|nr:HEAT repeat domain-containing protein [candidate division Zixibacteria bacterium]